MAASIQTRRIESDVLAVLENGIVEGGVYKLQGQLDRKMYERVKKVLDEGLGLKWNKKLRGHVCPDGDDVAERIEDAIQTGSYEKPNRLEFFETPISVVQRMLRLADVAPGMTVLEPSAGCGAIAFPVAAITGDLNVHCVEIDEARCRVLVKEGLHRTYQADFLEQNLNPLFDRVLMNPPFRHQADIDHVMHAWKTLKPGGRLVAVMSSSTMDRKTDKTIAFRALLNSVGTFEELPAGAFKQSGTGANTVLVVLDKAAS